MVVLMLTVAVLAAAPGRARGATCAGVTDGVAQASPAPGKPCWVEVLPYPFGNEGEPVIQPDVAPCKPPENNAPPCHLRVTSMAFRAWNRGLAAVRFLSGGALTGGTSAFGLWIYNGVRWFPDPTFPGGGTCPGDTVLWAGKLDYWLIGGTGEWSTLCRFDGDAQTWQPVRIPSTTVTRTTTTFGLLNQRLSGNITAGSCTAWDSCWFFGTYGTMLRWNGTSLQDVSPDPAPVTTAFSLPSRRPFLTGFLDASAARTADGTAVALAGGTSEGFRGQPNLQLFGGLARQPGGAPPPQLWGVRRGAWSGLAWTPATAGLPDDPFRSDVVAVDVEASGRGWVAANPSIRARSQASEPLSGVGPSPLMPVRESGADAGCTGPAADAFGRGGGDVLHDGFAWSELATFPGADRVIAGGMVKPNTDAGPPSLNRDGAPEAVVVEASCDGTARVTRFAAADPTAPDPKPLVAATRDRPTLAVAAPAGNRAWAATDGGILKTPGGIQSVYQTPHLYQYTDGQAPTAPAGDDNESRPIPIQEDPPIIVFVPDPPPPPAAPTKQVRSRTKALPPAIFKITSTVRNNTLVVSFRVRRSVMIGIAAERNGVVVATTGLRRFGPGTGRLELKLDPRRWPTKITFLSDAPTVTLKRPKSLLTKTTVLTATASAIKGRRIASVSFEYTRDGRTEWTQIAVDEKPPFSTKFDTRTVPNARYRFRAIAIDSAKQSAISPDVPAVTIRNRSAT